MINKIVQVIILLEGEGRNVNRQITQVKIKQFENNLRSSYHIFIMEEAYIAYKRMTS